MNDLTKIDAKILQFINGCGTADLASIKRKFPDVSAIEYRLKSLCTVEVKQRGTYAIPIENSAFLCEQYEDIKIQGIPCSRGLGIYELTDHGKRELENYQAGIRSYRKELWLKNAWIPIIVSIITSAIANYILPKLPQILQWIANTLSKSVS